MTTYTDSPTVPLSQDQERALDNLGDVFADWSRNIGDALRHVDAATDALNEAHERSGQVEGHKMAHGQLDALATLLSALQDEADASKASLEEFPENESDNSSRDVETLIDAISDVRRGVLDFGELESIALAMTEETS